MKELGRSNGYRDGPAGAAAFMLAAEAEVAETRGTVEAVTVSALQRTHALQGAETTAEGFFRAHKDMNDCHPSEQARKKQFDFLESLKVNGGGVC